MLIDAQRSALLVVDLQARMVPAIADGDAVVASVLWLVRIAQRLGVPVAAVEQYPQGLGALVPALRECLPAEAIAAKTRFSAVAEGCLPALPGGDRPQVVIVGAEAHVCVLQTALDLAAGGKAVYVVADAVGARRALDRDAALARMRAEGVRIVTREMVAFEWLREAGTERFRELNREFLREGPRA